MIKSLGLCAALLAIVLLTSAVSVSARTGGIAIPNPGSAIPIHVFSSAVNHTQIFTFLGSAIYTGEGDGNHDDDKDKDRDKDKDKDKDHGPSPTPEPSTMLSFGAALLIGGGVLYSRRLRRKGN